MGQKALACCLLVVLLPAASSVPGVQAVNKGSSVCSEEYVSCGKGEGDCDNDKDCAGALKCWQRSGGAHVWGIRIPKSFDNNTDICYDPDDEVRTKAGFTCVLGYQKGSNSLGTETGYSREQCEQKCLDNTKCLSFDYNRDKCWFSHTKIGGSGGGERAYGKDERYCRLKSRFESNRHNDPDYEETSGPYHCVKGAQESMNQLGTQTVANRSVCEQECSDNSNCLSFDFTTSSKCHLSNTKIGGTGGGRRTYSSQSQYCHNSKRPSSWQQAPKQTSTNHSEFFPFRCKFMHTETYNFKCIVQTVKGSPFLNDRTSHARYATRDMKSITPTELEALPCVESNCGSCVAPINGDVLGDSSRGWLYHTCKERDIYQYQPPTHKHRTPGWENKVIVPRSDDNRRGYRGLWASGKVARMTVLLRKSQVCLPTNKTGHWAMECQVQKACKCKRIEDSGRLDCETGMTEGLEAAMARECGAF